MNRCNLCGRFRKWEHLVHFTQAEMTDTYGTVEERDWFTCLRCLITKKENPDD